MYRRNQLKEELDRLRSENNRLKCENLYLKSLNIYLDKEIRKLQLFIIQPQPYVINVPSKVQSDFLENIKNLRPIIMPEPFETGIKLGVLKEDEEEKENE